MEQHMKVLKDFVRRENAPRNKYRHHTRSKDIKISLSRLFSMEIIAELQKALHEPDLAKKQSLVEACVSSVETALQKIQHAQQQLEDAQRVLEQEFRSLVHIRRDIRSSVPTFEEGVLRIKRHGKLLHDIQEIIQRDPQKAESIRSSNLPTVDGNLAKLVAEFQKCQNLFRLEDRNLAEEIRGALVVLKEFKTAHRDMSSAEK